MAPIRSLLISPHRLEAGYGSGQRLLSLKAALDKLGECRFLWLDCDASAEPPNDADYAIRSVLSTDQSRSDWVKRHLTFKELREDRAGLEQVERIHRSFPFDVAVCHFFQATGVAPLRLAPCLLDADALPEPEGRLTQWIWPMTRRVMIHRAKQFKQVFVIRASDGKVLDGIDTQILPCISATTSPIAEFDDSATDMLFVGSTKWQPNREAVEFLIRSVLPVVRQKHPDVRLRLVGGGTEEYSNVPGVSAGGFVPSLEEEYRTAAVVVCPVWSGAGANVKLAEALQYGCAVACSGKAAASFAGIVDPHLDVLTVNDSADFGTRLAQLLDDRNRLAALRLRARTLSETLLSQGHVDNVLREAVFAATGAAPLT